jgi:hypothetical protein
MGIYFAPDFSWLLIRHTPTLFGISLHLSLLRCLLAHDLSDRLVQDWEKMETCPYGICYEPSTMLQPN